MHPEEGHEQGEYTSQDPQEPPVRQSKDLLVFIVGKDSVCDECGETLTPQSYVTLTEDRRALCLACADLDHLVFLLSGDAALTSRARKYSTRSAVVLKWNRTRKRNERQGLLVEEQAIQRAEQACLGDADVRARRREREGARRAKIDRQFVDSFAALVRELFPRCPAGQETAIAEHACLKYSGRVGRSAAAKALSAEAITLAVVAHIRHTETAYDELLAGGLEQRDAREAITAGVARVLCLWRAPARTPP
jgi:hypothetical protein